MLSLLLENFILIDINITQSLPSVIQVRESSSATHAMTTPHDYYTYFDKNHIFIGDSTMPFTPWDYTTMDVFELLEDYYAKGEEPETSEERTFKRMMPWLTPVTPWVPGLPPSVKYRALRNFESDSDVDIYDEIRFCLELAVSRPNIYAQYDSKMLNLDENYRSLDTRCPLLQRVEVIGIIARPFVAYENACVVSSHSVIKAGTRS